MTTADVNRTVIGIINEVERKLAINQSTSLASTNFTTTLLDFLNDVIDECNDYGNWPHMFNEVTVTASSSVEEFEIASSAPIKNIHEIHFHTDVSPLEVRTVEDIRRLQRTRSFGKPRQFALVKVSGVNAKFRPSPIPSSAQDGQTFNIAVYEKNVLYTTADLSAIPQYPSRVLVQGVYAKAILEESGQEQTTQFKTAYEEYIRMRREALNRLTADTGTDVRFVPTGRY